MEAQGENISFFTLQAIKYLDRCNQVFETIFLLTTHTLSLSSRLSSSVRLLEKIKNLELRESKSQIPSAWDKNLTFFIFVFYISKDQSSAALPSTIPLK